MAHTVYFHREYRSCYGDYSHTNKCVDTDDIENGKQDEQRHEHATEVPDVLRLQAPKLYRFVNPLIDMIYTVTHFICFISCSRRYVSIEAFALPALPA